ncbi:Small glutamine-rich tetratricopeptide [Micractinium conductrix]|uniref:Small glutamine-rich tetratricopeptide n=1 Tax=Micractinium conductrix TaxID=554055 RepID=A0A2P6VIA0_9CHLO|nr:Small glutamine-rich tetratricopeptide [Micractinium conductrix]|eukprot:PSC73819.1 Small glutamine-rich tetratricopeptide [Micractinium conductrix]
MVSCQALQSEAPAAQPQASPKKQTLANSQPLQQQQAGGQAAAELSNLSLDSSSGNSGGSGTAPAAGARPRRWVEQEVDDDDDEVEGLAGKVSTAGSRSTATAAPAGGTANAAAQAAGGAQVEGVHPEESEGSDDEQLLDLRMVWDSSSSDRQRGAATEPRPAPDTASGPAAALKEQGNAHMHAGRHQAALQCYTAALAAAGVAAKPGRGGAAGADPQFVATLYSNRAHTLLKLRRHQEAATDALHAHKLHPTWLKPLYRLAQAYVACGQWAAAVAAARKGEGLAPQNSEGHTEFTPLLDSIAVAAARALNPVGFDGLQLEVRDAGDDAWLCGPAPHVPELDGPEGEDQVGPVTNLALPDVASIGSTPVCKPGSSGALTAGASARGAGGGDPLAAWDYRQTAAVQQRRRTSFRSIKEAVAAARDGDRIILRRGIHNGMGQAITLNKRVMIEGEGALGEATIDQRANVPTFRIVRGGVVLRNIDLDQTGYREALLVEGAAGTAPLLLGCRIKCSGDDAVNVGGSAAPTFLRCVISSKKCGVKAYGDSAPRFEQCSIEKCGEQGVRAMERAAPLLLGCTLSECEEEGVVGMDSARVALHRCSLRDCKGPGLDLSGDAQGTVAGGSIAQCVGGVWLWERTRGALHGADVAGGPSHALLADGKATVAVQESTLRGSVHATEAAWAGILHPSNTILDPEQPTDFPPEEGPFRWVPNPYTRKQ